MKSPALFAVALVWNLAIASESPAQSPPPEPVPPGLSPTAPSESPADDAQFWQLRREQQKAHMENGGWNVRVDVQMVAMPQARALQLLPELQSEDVAKVENAVKQIQEMIAKKEATLLGWPFVVGLDGEKAVSEAIEERRYPTDFDLPQQPQVHGPANVSSGPKEALLIPRSFETRNLGATLEANPISVFDDGKRIGLSIEAQRVTLVGNETFATGITKDGAKTTVDQPQFATERVNTELVVRNREHVLLAVHRMPKPEDQIGFFILHATATKAD